MWLLRSAHKHINQETLSEYLDGRLRGKDLERVEQRLADCDACRLELEELQATVAIMRQLPMETPRRSFVMSAPPPEPARSRPALALRAPNWVYAGAASVAALALAVTISVDATGGLTSDPLRVDAPVTAQAPAATAEAVTAASGAAESAPPSTSAPDDGSTSALSMAAADPTVAEETGGGAGSGASAIESTVRPSATTAPRPALSGAGGTALPEPGLASEDAEAAPPPLAAAAPTPAPPEPAVREGGGAGAAGSVSPPEPAAPPLVTPTPAASLAMGGGADAAPPVVPPAPSATPSPTAQLDTAAQAAGPTIAASAGPESQFTAAAPADGQALGPRSTTGAQGTSAVETEAEKALMVESPVPVAEPAEPDLVQEDGGKTSIWWRVLEAAAGVLAVAFLAGLAFRWRANRKYEA